MYLFSYVFAINNTYHSFFTKKKIKYKIISNVRTFK